VQAELTVDDFDDPPQAIMAAATATRHANDDKRSNLCEMSLHLRPAKWQLVLPGANFMNHPSTSNSKDT
jgi:hypothetical protein